MVKDLIGFGAVSGAIGSGFAGVHFYGQIHVVLVALMLIASIALIYVAWRALVPSSAEARGAGGEHDGAGEEGTR